MLSKLNEMRALKNLTRQKIRTLSEEILNEKVKKAVNRDMYTEIYKPITKGIESQKVELSKQLQALPIDFVNKMQEYQKAIEDKPEKNLPEEDIHKLFIDLNAGLDPNVLERYEYDKPSEMFQFFTLDESDPDHIDRNTLKQTIKDVSDKIQTLSGKIVGKSRLKNKDNKDIAEIEALQRDKNQLKNYKDALQDILRTEKYGQGNNYNGHKYKVSPKGHYGNLFIDLNRLYSQNRLVATNKNTGKVVLNKPVDNDLIELINKRFNKNKTYSKQSMKVFKELTQKSGLPINQRSMKFKQVIRGCPCNPNEMLDDLELICGSLESGNNNEDMINEGISIIDELLKMKQINPEEHEQIYNKYFS